MTNSQRRHDISAAAWTLLEPHLPRQSGQWGGVAKDNRLFINAVFWILPTGAPWRDLPPEYGKWGTVHQGFIRWRDKCIEFKNIFFLYLKGNCVLPSPRCRCRGTVGRSNCRFPSSTIFRPSRSTRTARPLPSFSRRRTFHFAAM